MKKMILTFAIAMLGTTLGIAQKVNVDKNNIANNGYDVVNSELSIFQKKAKQSPNKSLNLW